MNGFELDDEDLIGQVVRSNEIIHAAFLSQALQESTAAPPAQRDRISSSRSPDVDASVPPLRHASLGAPAEIKPVMPREPTETIREESTRDALLDMKIIGLRMYDVGLGSKHDCHGTRDPANKRKYVSFEAFRKNGILLEHVQDGVTKMRKELEREDFFAGSEEIFTIEHDQSVISHNVFFLIGAHDMANQEL